MPRCSASIDADRSSFASGAKQKCGAQIIPLEPTDRSLQDSLVGDGIYDVGGSRLPQRWQIISRLTINPSAQDLALEATPASRR